MTWDKFDGAERKPLPTITNRRPPCVPYLNRTTMEEYMETTEISIVAIVIISNGYGLLCCVDPNTWASEYTRLDLGAKFEDKNTAREPLIRELQVEAYTGSKGLDTDAVLAFGWRLESYRPPLCSAVHLHHRHGSAPVQHSRAPK